MPENPQPTDTSTRRKKLDELFENEPFLSPTMKAHRLYQKLEQQAAPPKTQPDSVRDARIEALPNGFGELRLVDASRPQEAVPQAAAPPKESSPHRLLGLVEAAAYIRHKPAAGAQEGPAAERLLRFREHVLARWVQDAPRRERSR
jgi:hypothetical protein